MITAEQLTAGVKVKLDTGTVFIINEVEINRGETIVYSQLENGTPRNYRNEISDCLDFLNEEKVVII